MSRPRRLLLLLAFAASPLILTPGQRAGGGPGNASPIPETSLGALSSSLLAGSFVPPFLFEEKIDARSFPHAHRLEAWHPLGQAAVRVGSSQVAIAVRDADRGTRTVKIQVAQAAAPLRIETVTIHFRDGTAQTVEIASAIASGAETRSIDLSTPGPTRVEIAYSTDVVASSTARIAKLRLLGHE